MKKIAAMFSDSAKEFGNVFSLCLTAVFIAVSMGLEMLSVDVGFKKINFAFLAIAVIGQDAREIMQKLRDIPCRGNTSCPDQLSRAIEQYLNEQAK